MPALAPGRRCAPVERRGPRVWTQRRAWRQRSSSRAPGCATPLVCDGRPVGAVAPPFRRDGHVLDLAHARHRAVDPYDTQEPPEHSEQGAKTCTRRRPSPGTESGQGNAYEPGWTRISPGEVGDVGEGVPGKESFSKLAMIARRRLMGSPSRTKLFRQHHLHHLHHLRPCTG